MRSTSAAAAAPASAAPARRLLVLRLGEGAPEVLRSQVLRAGRASSEGRPVRRRTHGFDGRYEVLDEQGRVAASGAFRIPRRVHALFGEVEGPAGPASVLLPRPVIWLRVPTPPGATRVRLRDAARRVALGEVVL